MSAPHTHQNTNQQVGVGSILVLVTVLSWIVTEYLRRGPLTDVSRDVLLVAAMSIAMFKVHLIGRQFMELKHAPTVLKTFFAGWMAVVWLAVVVPNLFMTEGAW